MTRRTFGTIVASALLAMGVRSPEPPKRPKFGSMNVDRWIREGHTGKRVLCDGADITDSCVWFDDELGEAEVLATDPPQIDPETGGFWYRIMRGRIEVIG